MKNDVLRRIRQESALASDMQPSFYEDLGAELAFARQMFFSHALARRCREDVLPFLNDDFGHGIQHSKKVAVETCALILDEADRLGMDSAKRLGLLGLLAGLLHDTCRLEGEHPVRGAELSAFILRDYPLLDAEKSMIAEAIACHEIISPAAVFDNPDAQLLADALYDADKFRWGADNFDTTLWEVCNYQEWSLAEILEKFPAGLDMARSVRDTFRTTAGKIHGPEIIDLGLVTGKKIYQAMQSYCREHDCAKQTLP